MAQALFLTPPNPQTPALKALTRSLRVLFCPASLGLPDLHVDAFDRAGGKTELATRASLRDHPMQTLRPTQDCIDRAGKDAFGTTDAVFGDDVRISKALLFTAVGVKRLDRLSGRKSQGLDALKAAWWAAIDVSLTGGNRLSIGSTGRVAATGALRLGEDLVNPLDKR